MNLWEMGKMKCKRRGKLSGVDSVLKYLSRRFFYLRVWAQIAAIWPFWQGASCILMACIQAQPQDKKMHLLAPIHFHPHLE